MPSSSHHRHAPFHNNKNILHMSPSLTDGDASQDVSHENLTFRPRLKRDTRSLGSADSFTELPSPALPSDTFPWSAESNGTEDLNHEAPSRLAEPADDDPGFGSRQSEAGIDAHDDFIPPVSRKVSWADGVEEIRSKVTRDEPLGDRIFYLVPQGHPDDTTSAAGERAASTPSRGRTTAAATPRGILKKKLPNDKLPRLGHESPNDQDTRTQEDTEWASDRAEASDEDQR